MFISFDDGNNGGSFFSFSVPLPLPVVPHAAPPPCKSFRELLPFAVRAPRSGRRSSARSLPCPSSSVNYRRCARARTQSRSPRPLHELHQVNLCSCVYSFVCSGFLGRRFDWIFPLDFTFGARLVPAVKRHIDAEKQKVSGRCFRFVAFLYDILASNAF